MSSEKSFETVAELLMAAGRDHHEAFIETHGIDPDWAIWYGNYLEEPFSNILNSKMSAAAITEKLKELDIEFNSEIRTEHWSKFYSKKLCLIGNC